MLQCHSRVVGTEKSKKLVIMLRFRYLKQMYTCRLSRYRRYTAPVFAAAQERPAEFAQLDLELPLPPAPLCLVPYARIFTRDRLAAHVV